MGTGGDLSDLASLSLGRSSMRFSARAEVSAALPRWPIQRLSPRSHSSLYREGAIDRPGSGEHIRGVQHRLEVEAPLGGQWRKGGDHIVMRRQLLHQLGPELR